MELKRFDGLSLSQDFTDFCITLLKKLRTEPVITEQYRDQGYDLKVELNNKNIFIELKLYRSSAISPATISNACIYLRSTLNEHTGHLLLIVSTEVNEEFKAELLKKYNVHLWDIKTLYELSIEDTSLLQALTNTYVRATGQSFPITIERILKRNVDKIVSDILNYNPAPDSSKIIIEEIGSTLCKELKAIAKGTNDDDDETQKTLAKQYEDKCAEIISYLFKEHLEIFKEQNHTDGNLYVFDLICRISSDHNFWQNLSKDLNTRYVIFEFKNYNKKIKQTQIFTTEKYLFTKALRSVAFIISRLGPDNNALTVAKGALRESGKLIVNLTDEDLCQMLHLKDKSDEHHEILINKIDEMLIKMVR